MICPVKQPFDRLSRRVPRSGAWPVAVEMARQGRGPPRQPLGLLVQIAVEPGLPLRLQRGFFGQDRRRRADGCNRRQQFMHALGQHEVMTHPVAQRVIERLERRNAPVLRGDGPGPTGKAGHQRVDPVNFGAQVTLLLQCCCGGQGAKQAGLGSAGQGARFTAERLCEVDQKLAANAPFVVLDQVEIAGRDPGPRGQFGLFLAKRQTPIPYPRPGMKVIFGHLAARHVAIHHSFTLQIYRTYTPLQYFD